MSAVFKYRDGGLVGATRPTEKQLAAGNPPMGHTVRHGMRITVENEAGTHREGVGEDGKPWKTKLRHDYGYIRGTTGKDKDHIDTFLGDHADSETAYVIDQNKKNGDFDEHKVMLGFPSEEDAVIAYHENYSPGWDGFHAVTAMPVNKFKDWAYAGKSGKRKRVSELVRHQQETLPGSDAVSPTAEVTTTDDSVSKDRSTGVSGDATNAIGPAKGSSYAEGGSVETPLTIQEIEAMAAADQPYSGGQGKRRAERNNDREGAKEAPLQAARGAVAGTLGFGGDIEGLMRKVHNLSRKFPSLSPVQALLSQLPELDETAALPTSDFYKDILPLKPQSKTGEAFSGAGTMAGGMPLSVPASMAAKAAVPAAKAMGRGALSMVNDAMHGGGGPLMNALTSAAQPAFAVKPKGGNWTTGNLDKELADLRGWEAAEGTNPVGDWLQKRVGDYVKKDMGTATDPLLQLEKEGKLHLDPEDLAQRADEHGMMKPKKSELGKWEPVDLQFHKQATGRDSASHWEQLTDSAVDPGTALQHLGNPSLVAKYPWLMKVDPNAEVNSIFRGSLDKQGFGHVRDYLNAATNAHDWRVQEPHIKEISLRQPVGRQQAEAAEALMARGLDINPADLAKMSLPDVIRKTSDWNKFIYKAKQLEDMNKGVKSVVKQYPETGHQWVELSPEGLEAEGNAMRHCVGGYCDSVESGQKRIMSLRDKDGRPAVTVEMAKGRHDPYKRMEEETNYMAQKGSKEGFDDWYDQQNPLPWDIRQIKGPANRKPSKNVLGYVQDFVKNQGPWGDVRDLENSGLYRSEDPADLNQYIRRNHPGIMPNEAYEVLKNYSMSDGRLKGYATTEEMDAAFNPLFDAYFGGNPGDYAAMKPPRKYAKGGAVGQEVVGLGTFATGDNGQQVQSSGSGGWGSGFTGTGSGSGVNRGVSVAGSGNSGNFGAFGDGTPPVIDTNTPGGLGFLNMTMQAGGAGQYDTGIEAILGNHWDDPSSYRENRTLNNAQTGGFTNYYAPLTSDPGNSYGTGSGDAGGVNTNAPPLEGRGTIDRLRTLAGEVGMDTSQYDFNGSGGFNYTAPRAMQARRAAQLAADPTIVRSANDFHQDLKDYTKDYARIGGLSQGWDGRGKERGTASTLYRVNNGVYTPASASSFGIKPENPGWIRGEGADFVQGMSMMLPMVGGWAGLLNSAAPALTGAATSAIGSTATNALINAAGAALTGGGAQGALGSLFGAAGGAAGSAAGNAIGAGYGAVGQQVGSQLARALYNNSQSQRRTS